MTTIQTWQPTTSIPHLIQRATIIKQIRAFFDKRYVLEVETPLMSHSTVTDINLTPFVTAFMPSKTAKTTPLYLITSPEYHMKRLLANGSGSIYQICRCFRNEDQGRYHNPEFTMLEWYRTGYDMMQLIDEVDQLLQALLHCRPALKISYQQLFLEYLDIDPLIADKNTLIATASHLGLAEIAKNEQDRDTLLQLLFAFGIEPKIGQESPVAVYYFPASQASLAEIVQSDSRIAKRFEFYFKGIELANGFQELTQCEEQKQRFMRDNEQRGQRQLAIHPIDQQLLAALAKGLPKCSGVALGVDRLIMLALGVNQISDVIAFPTDRA